jgi:hypothetical protein
MTQLAPGSEAVNFYVVIGFVVVKMSHRQDYLYLFGIINILAFFDFVSSRLLLGFVLEFKPAGSSALKLYCPDYTSVFQPTILAFIPCPF